MPRSTPKSSYDTYHWKNRYYPYYWWRRRYYPYYWWDKKYGRRYYSEDSVKNLPAPQSMSETNNISVTSLREAFSMKIDTMFIIKAMQYSRDVKPTDEDIYEIVDDMLEMYHANGDILEENDFYELASQRITPTIGETAEESCEPMPPTEPPPGPEPEPTAN
jgi:hypothetical protein